MKKEFSTVSVKYKKRTWEIDCFKIFPFDNFKILVGVINTPFYNPRFLSLSETKTLIYTLIWNDKHASTLYKQIKKYKYKYKNIVFYECNKESFNKGIRKFKLKQIQKLVNQ